jgi:hypothetical protein
MSVMPTAPTATQVAARSDQLSKLITECLAEVPQPALISTIVDQTAQKVSVIQPTSGSQATGPISRTADKVYAELIQKLDTAQGKLLRAGYIELWGVISGKTSRRNSKCILMPKSSKESAHTALRCWARLP